MVCDVFEICAFPTVYACFDPQMQGSTYVVQSFVEYLVNHGKVILLLVEAIGMFFFLLLLTFCLIILYVDFFVYSLSHVKKFIPMC